VYEPEMPDTSTVLPIVGTGLAVGLDPLIGLALFGVVVLFVVLFVVLRLTRRRATR
jgi:hypothetical protein